MLKKKPKITKTPTGVSITHEATEEYLECPEVCEEECVTPQPYWKSVAEMLSEQEKWPVVWLDDWHNYIKFEEYMELEKEIDELNKTISELRGINEELRKQVQFMSDRAFELERQKKNTEDRYLKLLWWYTVYRNNAIRTYNNCQQAWKQLDCELSDLGKDISSEY